MKSAFLKLLGVETRAVETCLGLYVGMNDMYFAQVVKNRTGMEVKGLLRIPVIASDKTTLRPLELNEGFFSVYDNWAVPLKKALEKRKLATNRVVVTLAPSFSMLRHFVMQDTEHKYWNQAIPLEARKNIHFPFDKAYYSYDVYPFETGVSKQKKLAVVFALTSQSIVKHLQAGLKSVGLELAGVETSVFSEARVFKETDKEAVAKKGRIYSFFGTEIAELLFLNEAGIPILSREYDISGPMPISRRRLDLGNLTDFISKQLEKDIFEEVVALGSNTQEWARVLEAESKKIIRVWDAKEAFGFSPGSAGEMASIGACVKFASEDAGAEFDLLPNKRMGKEETSAVLTLWKAAFAVFALCLAAVLFALFGMKTASMRYADETSKTSMEEFRGQTPSQVLSAVETLEKKNKVLNSFLKSDFVTPKLVYFANNTLEKMWLTRFDYKEPLSLDGLGKERVLVEGLIAIGTTDIRNIKAYGDGLVDIMAADPNVRKWCTPQAEYPIESARGQKGAKFLLRCNEKGSK